MHTYLALSATDFSGITSAATSAFSASDVAVIMGTAITASVGIAVAWIGGRYIYGKIMKAIKGRV